MNGVELRPIFSGYEPGSDAHRAVYNQAPVYDRSITLHTREETSPFLDLMAQHNMVMMRGHGIVVAGRTVEEATSRALTLESLARLNWLAHLGGGAPDISDEDKAEWLRRDRESIARRPRGRRWLERAGRHTRARRPAGRFHRPRRAVRIARLSPPPAGRRRAHNSRSSVRLPVTPDRGCSAQRGCRPPSARE